MPFEQALAPDELSAIQILPVPDLWPPTECRPVDFPPTAGLPGPPSARMDGSGDQAWPRQFAVLLIEALTGDRPARQVLPWLSERGRMHLHRLRPLFDGGQGARVQRVVTTQPSPDVIEMTLVVAVGPRIRALAVRLTLIRPQPRREPREKPAARAPAPPTATSPRWLCTDIEAA
jgi:hypothetical protein